MKIRNGFVSNSSSSSFIISDKHFPTVRSLAIYMLNKKIEDYESDFDEEEKEENYYDKLLITRLSNVDENDPVSFSSCNYDTYIKKVADCYLVSTCNNTRWELYDYTTSLTESAINELKEIQKNYIESDDDDYNTIENILDNDYDFSSFDNDYYSLDKEIIGVETYDYCPNHDKEIHKKDYSPYLWNTKKWGVVCLKCNPYIKRKDKLDAINKCKTDNE